MGRKLKTSSEALTTFELKIMTIIWKLGSASVHAVLENLRKDQDFAYTTISTMMRVLEQKGVLESVKNGKTHVYVPILEREAYGSFVLNQVIKELFADQPSLLFEKMLKEDLLNKADLAEAKLLISIALEKK